MKQCIICKTSEVKNPNKDWHKGPTCKRCYGREKAREIYKNNPEKIKLKNKVWAKANKGLIREINKVWVKNNPDKLKIYNENAKEYKAEYYKTNKEKYKKLHAEYYQQNKLKIISSSLKKRHSNPLVKLRHNISTYINKSLMQFKTNKSKKALIILGSSINETKTYLESKFRPGMSWNNYGSCEGQWNIDHICPLSQALNEDELYKLWNYTNLQPMWVKDNIKKSNNAYPESIDMCIKLLNRGWL